MAQAELVDGLCRRYSCLPSQLLQEDASLLRRLAIVNLAKEGQVETGDSPAPPSMEEMLANMSTAGIE